MKKLDLLALQVASEAFATNPIPDNWNSLTEEEQNEWLDDHRYAPFENDQTDEFFGLIDSHADTVSKAIDHALKELHEKIIESFLDGSFPSDARELDLKAMING